MNKMHQIITKIRKKNINNETLLKWANRTVGTALAISYALAAYSVIRTQMIPNTYLIFGIPITSLMITLLVIANLKKKLSFKKDIVLILCSLLIIATNLYVFSIGIATIIFLNGIQSGKYAYQEYSIIAIKDRHISLSANNKQQMGLLTTDTNSKLVKEAVNKKTKVNYKDYSDITSMTVALENKTVDMAVIDSPHLQLIKENYDNFYQSLEILSTFKIIVKTDVVAKKTDIDKPFILYISGIDTYGDIATVSRSDVNILAVFNPQTHKILLVNTPRDYYVQLHGTSGVKDKLTHAGIYGIDMSIMTLEDLYGISINYYLRINFLSLTKIVDVLGGVDVYSDYNFTVDNYSFHQGYNQLNGDQALTFSRERHSFEGGDQTRGENQQRVIEAIITKMNNPSTLVNYQNILASSKGTFQTNMSSGDMTTLIKNQLDDMSKWNVKSISVDGTGGYNSTYSMGNIPLYVMEPDITSINNAKKEISQYLK
jgi:LCP family protein required for cell wall assembly